MKALAIILLVAGAALCSFGYWGMFTFSGNRAYDEMDGIYPFFALLGGSIMIIAAIAMFLIALRRKKIMDKKHANEV